MYFQLRALVEAGDLTRISVAELRRFRDVSGRLRRLDIDEKYAAWARGDQRSDAALGAPKKRANGSLAVEVLPFPYEQFGSLPGVA
jgi:hypothetical protein